MQQFDSLTIAVLEFLKAQQSQSFLHLRQAQHNLRFQLKVNAGLYLYFQPLTEPELLPEIDVDDLFREHPLPDSICCLSLEAWAIFTG